MMEMGDFRDRSFEDADGDELVASSGSISHASIDCPHRSTAFGGQRFPANHHELRFVDLV